MNVQGFGPQHARSMGQMKQQQADNAHAEKSRIKDKILQQHEPDSSEISVVNAEESKGVVQKIQEGHFKGVADVRLRINYHEELQKNTTVQVAEQVEKEAEALDEAVTKKVTELEDEFNFAAEISYSFSFSVTSQRQQITMDTPPNSNEEQPLDVSSIIGMFKTTFDEIFEALSALDPAAAPDSAAATTAVMGGSGTNQVNGPELQNTEAELSKEPAGDAEPQLSGFQQKLVDLRSFFETELASIEERLRDIMSPPPLSPPQGNGVAYDRFLGMYNDLYGLTEDSSEDAETEQPDAIKTIG